jgi:hypothetical protein
MDRCISWRWKGVSISFGVTLPGAFLVVGVMDIDTQRETAQNGFDHYLKSMNVRHLIDSH